MTVCLACGLAIAPPCPGCRKPICPGEELTCQPARRDIAEIAFATAREFDRPKPERVLEHWHPECFERVT